MKMVRNTLYVGWRCGELAGDKILAFGVRVAGRRWGSLEGGRGGGQGTQRLRLVAASGRFEALELDTTMVTGEQQHSTSQVSSSSSFTSSSGRPVTPFWKEREVREGRTRGGTGTPSTSATRTRIDTTWIKNGENTSKPKMGEIWWFGGADAVI